jgi:serine/threonine-protein kinase
MGIVYRARDRVLDRLVALKELPPEFRCNESLAARFEREARVLAQLTHTNIVQVYDLVHEGGRMWMAMELIQGGSLAELLEARGALVVEEVTRLGGDLARALSFAHQRGVIHRDFKPGNVLLTPEGVPKVTDFGLAKLMQQAPTLTHAGSVLGSPSYMSPEQAAGRDVDARSDIYSFGVTLYEMATGRTPFQGDTMSVMRQHLTQEPPPPRDHAEQLPGSLESLILAMLAKDPAERTPDMETVAAKLGG